MKKKLELLFPLVAFILFVSFMLPSSSFAIEKIVFKTWDEGSAFDIGKGIWMMNPDGSGREQILSGSFHNPVISPDGTRLAYASDESGSEGIYIYNFQDGSSQLLVAAVNTAFPGWSPDSNTISYVIFGQGLFVVPSSGGTSRQIAGRSQLLPKWCGSDHIVSQNHLKILKINVSDGSAQTLISKTDSGEAEPACSDDGSLLSWSHYATPSSVDIYVANSDGTDRRKITNFSNPNAFASEFSPNGNSVVFGTLPYKDRSKPDDIWKIDINGSNLLQLTQGFNAGSPNWGNVKLEPPAVQVALDIKPGGCENPINYKSSGKTPVAILGSEDFDVSTIDTSTIRLAGQEGFKFALEDVANATDCDGTDGIDDLTFKIRTQTLLRGIKDAVGDLSDGDVVSVEVSGNLLDGTPITGSDDVWILKKGKKRSRN